MDIRYCQKSRFFTKSFAFSGVVLIALTVSGCFKQNAADITGSINQTSQTMTEPEKRIAVDQLGRQYEKYPGDKKISLSYARMLRDVNQINQAIAVLQSAAVKHPNDRDVAAAYGKALADGGRFGEAQEVLSRAHTPDRPDWRILSTQGAISDQMGKPEAAQQYYNAALQLRPGDPNVLSNLGLSYALSNRLVEAEQVMRQAIAHPAATPRVRGNLALVLALQGKYQEAEQAASTDLSPTDAAANMAFMRSMTHQNNSWRQLQSINKAPGANSQQRQTQR